MNKIIKISLGLIILSIVSILLVDKGLALYIHRVRIDEFLILRNITEEMPPIITVLVGLLILYNFRARFLLAIGWVIYFYLSLSLSLLLKSGIKMIFGRYWPQTWINNNLSLLKDGVYGFDYWHGFNNQGSFPSGHSMYIAFCFMWLSFLSPKYQKFFSLLVILMVVCQVGLNYHFLGDALAGVALGLFCGGLSLLLLKNRKLS